MNLQFKKFDGTLIKNVGEYVKDWVIENPYGNIIIGCDSQEYSRYIKYAITIVMHYIDEFEIGHGGHVIYAIYIDKSKNMKSDVYTKLWAEAVITISMGKMIGNIGGKKPTLHLDYNSKETEYSHVMYNAGIGFALQEGFEAFGKPYAYAASNTADKIAKKSGRN